MKQFATSLIWGEYTEGKLLEMFRYAEGDTLYSIIGRKSCTFVWNGYRFHSSVRIVRREKALWKEQLEHSKIVQPFLQIERPVFVVEENDKITVERFGGILLNGRSLFGKMTKLGWIRGSVQDGVYYTFYKEDTSTGLGAQLSFSGAPIGMKMKKMYVCMTFNFIKQVQ